MVKMVLDEDLQEEIAAAREREGAGADSKPRARSSHYDEANGRVVVELTSGWSFSFPRVLISVILTSQFG